MFFCCSYGERGCPLKDDQHLLSLKIVRLRSLSRHGRFPPWPSSCDNFLNRPIHGHGLCVIDADVYTPPPSIAHMEYETLIMQARVFAKNSPLTYRRNFDLLSATTSAGTAAAGVPTTTDATRSHIFGSGTVGLDHPRPLSVRAVDSG